MQDFIVKTPTATNKQCCLVSCFATTLTKAKQKCVQKFTENIKLKSTHLKTFKGLKAGGITQCFCVIQIFEAESDSQQLPKVLLDHPISFLRCGEGKNLIDAQLSIVMPQ